nr:hypothetical protein [Thermoleophilaceae bacterium]
MLGVETIERRVARVEALEGSRRVRRGEVEERALTTVDLPWLAPPTAAGIAVTPEGALRLVDVLA